LQAFNLEFANHHATVDADDEQSCSQQRKRMSSASEELLEIEKKKLTILLETSGSPQQWAEPRLEAVRKGQVCQAGVTDFGPGVERFSEPCAKKE